MASSGSPSILFSVFRRITRSTGASPRLTPSRASRSHAVMPGLIGGTAAYTVVGPGGPLAVRQVTGKPYFLELESEQEQTLADGTHIARKNHINREYRDSLGRTRTEQQPMLSGQSANTLGMVQISDPVARVRRLCQSR